MSDPTARLNAALEGRYRIERELGEGGMATVYLADDLRHERKVALKVLKPELAAVVGAERFLAEIKTTANLQHPHILPLFDSGEAEGFLFYVMPDVEGETPPEPHRSREAARRKRRSDHHEEGCERHRLRAQARSSTATSSRETSSDNARISTMRAQYDGLDRRCIPTFPQVDAGAYEELGAAIDRVTPRVEQNRAERRVEQSHERPR
jgi:hypothetical protein